MQVCVFLWNVLFQMCRTVCFYKMFISDEQNCVFLSNVYFRCAGPCVFIKCLFQMCRTVCFYEMFYFRCAGLCVYEGRGGLCSVRLSLPLLKLRPRKDLVETLLVSMCISYCVCILCVTKMCHHHGQKHVLR